MIKFEIVLHQHTLNIIQQKRERVLVQFSYWVESETCNYCDLHFEYCAYSPLASVLTASETHVFSAGITEGMLCLIISFGQIDAPVFFPFLSEIHLIAFRLNFFLNLKKVRQL